MKRPALLVLFFGMLAFQSAQAVRSPTNQHDFREIFYQLLDPSQQSNFPKLAYEIPQELLVTPKNSKTAIELMNKLGEVYKKYTNEDLYKLGKSTYEMKNSFLSSNYDLQTIKKINKKHPITIVLVPGILGEFIEDKVYKYAYSKKVKRVSPFYKKWANNFKRHPNKSDKYDLMLSPAHTTLRPGTGLGQVNTPMSKLVDVGAISDGKNDLVRMVHLEIPYFSFESLGDMYQRSELYLRRLTKFFNIMGKDAPKNIVFVGYSRGHIIGMDLLHKARERRLKDPFLYPWMKNVRGLVSLGGVNYGTELSDEAVCEGPNSYNAPAACKQLYLMNKLSDDLKYVRWDYNKSTYSNVMRASKIIAKNNITWSLFLKDMALVGGNPFSGMMGFTQFWDSLKKNSTMAFATQHRLFFGLLKNFAFTMVNMQSPFSEYMLNVKKFKLAIKEFYISVKQLRTFDRLNQWKKTNLPTKNIRYYNITGVMMEPQEGDSLSLLRNPFCFNFGSSDYYFLLDSYRQIKNAGGFTLNDTQVALHKTILRNEYNELLNPYYKKNPIDITVVGAMGTHHWGFAFPVAFKTYDKSENPFPRLKMIHALSTMVGLDIESGALKTK